MAVLHERGGRAGCSGIGKKAVSIDGKAGDGDEQAARPDQTGVVVDRCDGRGRVAAEQAGAWEPIEQGPERTGVASV